MAATPTTISDDGTTKVVEWRDNGKLVCRSVEPSAAIAAVEAAKNATFNSLAQTIRDLLDSGKSNPAQAALNRALCVAVLALLEGRDAALAADAL